MSTENQLSEIASLCADIRASQYNVPRMIEQTAELTARRVLQEHTKDCPALQNLPGLLETAGETKAGRTLNRRSFQINLPPAVVKWVLVAVLGAIGSLFGIKGLSSLVNEVETAAAEEDTDEAAPATVTADRD